MDRAKAKSMTRTVQTVAVALVAAAGLAAFIPLSVKAEPVADAPADPTPPKPKVVETTKVELDATATSAFLNLVSGPVKNQPVEVGTNDTAPPQPPPTGIGSWRYLGGIISSSYKRAILVIDDQQRLLAEGQTINDVEIVQIDKAFVKVKQGEAETTIDIAPRQKPTLTVLDPSAVARASGGNSNGSGNAGFNQPIANPAAARGAVTGAASLNAKNRQRDLERMKADAKARGDERSAEMLDGELNGLGKDGKGEKGQK